MWQKQKKALSVANPTRLCVIFGKLAANSKKVNWPTRREAINLTAIVLAVTFGMSIIMGFLDLIFSRLFALIFQIGS